MTDSSESQSPPEQPAIPRRNWVWLFIHSMVYLPMRFWCRTRVVGYENVAADRGGVFIVNHQSFLDPLFVAVRLTRSVSYLARDSLFKVPFIGWIVRNTYVIPISRTAFRGGSIRTALDYQAIGLAGINIDSSKSLPVKTAVLRVDAPIEP